MSDKALIERNDGVGEKEIHEEGKQWRKDDCLHDLLDIVPGYRHKMMART